jgi:hypothetical protein
MEGYLHQFLEEPLRCRRCHNSKIAKIINPNMTPATMVPLVPVSMALELALELIVLTMQ